MDQTETFLSVVKDAVDQLETLAGCGVYPPVLMRSIITRLSAASKRGLPTAQAPAAPAAPVAAPAPKPAAVEQPKAEDKTA